jgi:hypothetical protein
MTKEKRAIDWKRIELDYRAGIRTLRAIAEEHGITHGAINKRAKAEGWPRDLSEKIKSAAQDKVSKALVSRVVSKEALVTERQVVEANAEIIAQADLINRKDVLLALNVSRSQLEEVATLCEPDLRGRLIALGEACEIKDTDRPDKANELYRYIISLAGRVKLSKEIAAAHGVYIPMQRKILKLDEEGDKSQSNLDALIARINAAEE